MWIIEDIVELAGIATFVWAVIEFAAYLGG